MMLMADIPRNDWIPRNRRVAGEILEWPPMADYLAVNTFPVGNATANESSWYVCVCVCVCVCVSELGKMPKK